MISQRIGNSFLVLSIPILPNTRLVLVPLVDLRKQIRFGEKTNLLLLLETRGNMQAIVNEGSHRSYVSLSVREFSTFVGFHNS